MDHTSRRRFLEAVAAGTATLVVGAPLEAWAHVDDVSPASLKPSRIVCKVGDRFLPNAVAVALGGVRFPLIEDPKTRLLSYGKPIWGDLTITLPISREAESEVDFVGAWLKSEKKGAKGAAMRRDISLFLHARDKKTILRTFHAKECVPISLDSGDHRTASEFTTLTCKVGYIEFKT